MVQVFGVYPVQCLMHFKVWWKGETIVKDVTRLDPGPIFRNGLTNNTFSLTKRGGLKSVWGQSAGSHSCSTKTLKKIGITYLARPH